MSKAQTLTIVPGVGPSIAEVLVSKKIDSVKKLARIDLKKLTSVQGIGEISGQNMIQGAKNLLAADKSSNDKEGKKGKKDKKDKKKGGKNKKGKKDKNKKGKKKNK